MAIIIEDKRQELAVAVAIFFCLKQMSSVPLAVLAVVVPCCLLLLLFLLLLLLLFLLLLLLVHTGWLLMNPSFSIRTKILFLRGRVIVEVATAASLVC